MSATFTDRDCFSSAGFGGRPGPRFFRTAGILARKKILDSRIIYLTLEIGLGRLAPMMTHSRRQLSLMAPDTKHSRVDFINFRNGQMVDPGGYEADLTTAQAVTAAKIIRGFYNYDKISIEAQGVIIAVVS